MLLPAALLFAAACAETPRELILASTTSTQDSGLLDDLIPAFEAAHPDTRVKVIAVGSGEALALGRRGDADVLLVHSPQEEIAFVNDGYGMRRLAVMYNDFVIVGPTSDPARISSSRDVYDALRRIAVTAVPFISRGDSSGTHRKELRLWQQSGTRPSPDYLVEVGQGMAETLMIASEREAYTLADRGTFLSAGSVLELTVLREGDADLRNPYSVIEVRNARNATGARAFADWLVSDAGRTRIASFGTDRFGQPLFFPNPRSD